jgi:nucleoside 2-deoxyribosyltransferase
MSRDYRGIEDDNAEKIVEGDKEDIVSCDVVLVNANGPNWGTAMELVYASQCGKEVVAFATHGNVPRISPWLRMHTTAIYESLSHALAAINDGSAAGMR